MANLRLKKLILEVVDNQLRDNDPPKTTEIYNRLMEAGYSSSEAKEKIGAVVIEEIYNVMKEHQNYDEKKYEDALEETAQQCIDLEDTHKIQTEWDDLDWIDSQLDSFNSSLSKSEYYGDLYDDFSTPKQPVVKEQKIYPNNPCPCGSGKKYKKCCGRNR